jgi:hypothetical protein
MLSNRARVMAPSAVAARVPLEVVPLEPDWPYAGELTAGSVVLRRLAVIGGAVRFARARRLDLSRRRADRDGIVVV